MFFNVFYPWCRISQNFVGKASFLAKMFGENQWGRVIFTSLAHLRVDSLRADFMNLISELEKLMKDWNLSI